MVQSRPFVPVQEGLQYLTKSAIIPHTKHEICE